MGEQAPYVRTGDGVLKSAECRQTPCYCSAVYASTARVARAVEPPELVCYWHLQQDTQIF